MKSPHQSATEPKMKRTIFNYHSCPKIYPPRCQACFFLDFLFSFFFGTCRLDEVTYGRGLLKIFNAAKNFGFISPASWVCLRFFLMFLTSTYIPLARLRSFHAQTSHLLMDLWMANSNTERWCLRAPEVKVIRNPVLLATALFGELFSSAHSNAKPNPRSSKAKIAKVRHSPPRWMKARRWTQRILFRSMWTPSRCFQQGWNTLLAACQSGSTSIRQPTTIHNI